MPRLGIAIVALGLAVAGLGTPRSAEASQPGDTAVIAKRVIGHSAAGRPIVAWHLGREQAAPTVVLFSTMHGNEPATRQILRALRDGPPIRGIDLWVVPT